MKNIPMKRILRWYLAMIIFASLYVIAVPVPVLAETGSITVTDETAISNYVFNTPNSGTTAPTMASFNFDTSDFNSVNQYWIIITTNPTGFFAKESNSTFFTCASGCTGSGGVVSYNKNGSIINWDFAPDFRVTASPFTLTYEVNIFDSNNFNFGSPYQSSEALSATQPMSVRSPGGQSMYLANTGEKQFNNYGTFQKVVTETYSVNYTTITGTTQFNVAIDKTGLITTKNIFESSTIEYGRETAFSTTDFNSEWFNYADGLYINMTTATGAYTRQLVNSSGATDIPAVTPTPTINPITGAGIIWGQTEYIVGDFASISWVFNDDTWFAFAYDYYLDVFDSTGTKRMHEIVDQEGLDFITLDKTGIWTAKIEKYIKILGIDSGTLESANTAVNPEGQSFINTNQTVSVGKNFTATYRFGFTPENTDFVTEIKVQKLKNDGSLSFEKAFGVPLSNNVANTIYNQSIFVNNEGKYIIQLFSGKKGVIATTQLDAIYAFTTPTINITTSYLNISKDIYSFGEYIQGDYAVDNNNYSTYQNYIDIYNNDRGMVTATFTQTKQFDSFAYEITNTGVVVNINGILQGFSDNRFVAGSNTLRLRAKNSTIDRILATKDFNLSEVNTAGYALSVSSETVCKGEVLTVFVTSPTSTNFTITKNLYVTRSWDVPAGSIKKAYKIPLVSFGIYEIRLLNSNGFIEDSRIVDFKDCAATAPPGSTPSTPNQATIDVGNLLSSNIFWAFVMITGMIVVTGIETSKRKSDPLMPCLVVAMLGLGAFTLIGWVPSWILFSIILALAVAWTWQTVRNQNTG